MHNPATLRRWLPASFALAALVAGCTVNTSPEVPTWDTEINVPLVSQVHTMEDLLGDDAVVMTSSETGLLGFRVEGDTVTTTMGDHLSITGFTGLFQDSLGNFDLRDPGIQQSGFDFATLWPPSVGLDGTSAPVPAFSFSNEVSNLPDFTTFGAVTLSAGTLSVTITNHFPVALDISALELIEQGSGTVVTTVSFPSSIAPGDSATQSTSLAGAAFSNQLGVRVSGGSPGSGTPVAIDKDATIAVGADMNGLSASSATAQVPATDFSFADALALPNDMTVTTATLESGSLVLDLDSAIPLGTQITITIPELTAPGGGALVVNANLAAGGQSNQVIDLAGYALAPGAPVSGTQSLDVDVDAQTVDTGGSSVTVSAGDGFTLDAQISDLALESVVGILSATTVDIPADTSTVEFPDGLESVGLIQASLDLVITTEVQFPLDVDLIAQGRGQDGAIYDLPIQGTFAAGPGAGERELHITLDETNSQIVDFLNALPEEIVFGGDITVGDGIASSSVAEDDSFSARFVMSTPLRLSIEEQTIRPDPTSLVVIEGTEPDPESEGETSLSPDVTERLIEGSVQIQVSNGLPFGMQVRVRLATDSIRVHTAPDVVVGPFTVTPGQIDGITGLVLSPVTTTSDLTLTSEDLDIFKNPYATNRRVWGGVELVIAGTGGTAVAVRPSDAVTVSALAHLEVNVDLADNE